LNRTGGVGGVGAGRRPISFLVRAALLALLDLGTEAGVVETQAVAASPLGGLGVGERRRPDLSPAGPFPRNGEEERRASRKGE
jgi:hypothetical protein